MSRAWTSRQEPECLTCYGDRAAWRVRSHHSQPGRPICEDCASLVRESRRKTLGDRRHSLVYLIPIIHLPDRVDSSHPQEEPCPTSSRSSSG